jgi:transcriptional regulator with XRE-family HTH domain
MGLLMSQDDFAKALREAGIPGASKRLVQRWEAGTTGTPRPIHARALEQVTGVPIESLGFTTPIPLARVTDDERGGHDVETSPDGIPAAVPPAPRAQPATAPRLRANYAGIWLSRYEYFSSGRGEKHTGLHYVVILQHGNKLTVRSLPGSSDSSLTIDLEVDGMVATGTWSEQTARTGYYQGARYHGAIQLVVELTDRRMSGKWVGFGKEFEINTGPWELVFQDASTSKAAMQRYNRPPADQPPVP